MNEHFAMHYDVLYVTIPGNCRDRWGLESVPDTATAHCAAYECVACAFNDRFPNELFEAYCDNAGISILFTKVTEIESRACRQPRICARMWKCLAEHTKVDHDAAKRA